MMLTEEEVDEQIKKIRTDPVWFGREICNIDFDIWQIEALNAMADPIRKHMYGMPTVINHEVHTKFTIRAMHGPGKTFFAAFVLVWFHTAFKGISPATAPTLKQLKNRLWPNIRKIRAQSNKFLKKMTEVRATEVLWFKDSDWKVVAETGATPENLQGYHDEFMLIVCDEASGIREEMFPVIEGAMSTGTIVLLLLIGNPTRNVGTFADSHLKPKVSKNYYKIHVDLDKTTRVSKDWVRQMVDKYGKDSPVVKIRCFGEFAEADEGQLISVDWLEQARAKPGIPDGSLPRKVLSVDCADGGDNYTVITVANHYQSFVHWLSQTKHSFSAGRAAMLTADEVVHQWNTQNMSSANGDVVVVDSLGVGAGVCSVLLDRGLPVIRYIGGSSSDNIRLYRNRRVQSYMVLRDCFRDERAAFDDDFVSEQDWDDLYAQLCTIRMKDGAERLEDLLTKKEMKDQGITSPDRADSMAMQFATQHPMMGGVAYEDMLIGNVLESYKYDGAIAS